MDRGEGTGKRRRWFTRRPRIVRVQATAKVAGGGRTAQGKYAEEKEPKTCL